MSDEKLQLIKTVSFKQENDEGNKEDVLVKVLKNEDTGEKFLETIENPTITYYITKDEYESDTPVSYIEVDKVRPVTTSSSNIVKSVAYETGQEEFFWDSIRDKKFKQLGAVQLDPNVHGSDVNLEDYYIAKHYEKYPRENSNGKLTKGFFDIEVRSAYIDGFPEPERAECPIDAISYFNDSNLTMYVFLLRDDKNPQIEEFEANIKEFKKRIKEKYRNDESKKLRIDDFKIKITFYDECDELDLIRDFFNIIHYFKPDFMGAWNLTSFDMNYISNRIIQLGESPDEILCVPESDYAYSKLNIDTYNQSFGDKNSTFTCIDYTNWYDQLLLFANLRKSNVRESYKLDDIAFEEVGARKLHFKNPETTIKTSCYDNYEEFVEYNIHDTALLYLIERKNQDFDLIYTISSITQTRVNYSLKKTICIRNLARKFYLDNGLIMSNNPNKAYGELNKRSRTSFRGAMVADPNLNNSNGLILNGSKSKFLYNNVIDFDLTSLYPSIILAFNVDATTEIGKIETLTELFSSDELFDDIVANDTIKTGHKYFNLPSLEDMVEKIDKSDKKKKLQKQ
jgi:DNA polymerase elongation subunit (family B)